MGKTTFGPLKWKTLDNGMDGSNAITSSVDIISTMGNNTINVPIIKFIVEKNRYSVWFMTYIINRLPSSISADSPARALQLAEQFYLEFIKKSNIYCGPMDFSGEYTVKDFSYFQVTHCVYGEDSKDTNTYVFTDLTDAIKKAKHINEVHNTDVKENVFISAGEDYMWYNPDGKFNHESGKSWIYDTSETV